jgi:signal transduction histidine kinase/ligand-binding sensor domain-containing protein
VIRFGFPGPVWGSTYHSPNLPQTKHFLDQEAAASSQGEDENFVIQRVSVQQSLSNPVVQDVVQDQRGFLWIGTEGGLYKYDGYRFALYQQELVGPSETSPLSSQDFEVLFVDSQGWLWVGTGERLYRLDQTSQTLKGYNQGRVYTIFEDSSGKLWVSTSMDIFQYDPTVDQLRPWAFENRIIVSAIYETKPGVLWLGTFEQGIYRYDQLTGEIKNYRHNSDDMNSLSQGVITAIVDDRQGNLWVGTIDGGLNRLKLNELGEERFIHYRFDPDDPHSLSDDRITSLVMDPVQGLWVATGKGLNYFDPQREVFTRYQPDPLNPNSLSSEIILSLYVDRTGVLWVGSIFGLDKIHRYTKNFRSYQQERGGGEGLSGSIVLSIYEDTDGILWVGTFNDGLHRIDRTSEQYTNYLHDPDDSTSLSNNNVWSIYRDHQGTLWVGTDNGLNRFDLQTGEFYSGYRFQGTRVTSIVEDQTGTLWIGTSQGLFYSYLRTFSYVEWSRGIWINNVYVDRDGDLWIGTDQGFYIIDTEANRLARHQHDPESLNSLSGDSVIAFSQDTNNVVDVIWIGTFQNGLNRFKRESGEFVRFGEKDGLPSDSVVCLQVDADGRLWLATIGGLIKFDPKTETFNSYDAQDGLLPGGFYSCYQNEAGEMFFGAVQGLNVFYPHEILENTNIPPVVITTFEKFNQTVATDLPDNESIHLDYNDNFLSFEFAALDFLQPEKNMYAYMMEGLDEDWVYSWDRRHVDYPDLKPGDYVFRVKAANSDGFWNETGAAVSITIRSPIWGMWWFWGLVGIALLGSAYGAYRLRVYNIQARSRELEQLVEQRTSEIERRRRELEALYNADEKLHRHLELDQVLQDMIDIALEVLGADKGSLMVWDEGRERLVVRVARGFKAETLAHMSFAPGEGAAGRTFIQEEPVIIEDAQTDPRVTKQIIAAEGIRSLMQVPVDVGGEIFGVFSADYTQSQSFTDEQQRLLVALAQRAGIAIENAQLYEQAQELAVVRERDRLSRDLHDSLTQSLYSVNLYADAAERQLSSGKVDLASEHLNKLRSTVEEALIDMRLLIFELRPSILKQEGLVQALQARLETVEERAGIKTQFVLVGEGRLPPDIEEGFYRIALEALTNALKYAQAGKITVTLRSDQNSAYLEVADDGVGFDLQEAEKGSGMGLPGMLQRAERLGGVLSVHSEPGVGTRVIAEVEISAPQR